MRSDRASERSTIRPKGGRERKTGQNKHLLAWVSKVLIVSGFIALLISAGINGCSYYTQWRLRKVWERKVEELNRKNRLSPDTKALLRSPSSPKKELVKQKGLAYLVIPCIDLRAVVFEGTDFSDLIKGPGHLKETSLPGQEGNCVIAGHRTLCGAPFGNLDVLTPGADILVYTDNHVYHYVVAKKKTVSPSDLSVIDQTRDSRLTLITCHPRSSDRKRLVVIARLEETIY